MITVFQDGLTVIPFDNVEFVEDPDTGYIIIHFQTEKRSHAIHGKEQCQRFVDEYLLYLEAKQVIIYGIEENPDEHSTGPIKKST